MKKHFFFPALILLTFFTGCYKKAYADSKSISSVKNQNKHQNETPKIDPKIKKLETVISKMTPRFLETITKNDPRSFPDEFFSDIEKVLEAEKNFPADDLSLYYLIDKKHKGSSEYEPKNLRPLVKNNY